jgi:hypothetical protein
MDKYRIEEEDNMDFSIWKWLRERRYTLNEIKELIVEIKKFNAGIIDPLLDKHVDKALSKWIEDHQQF